MDIKHGVRRQVHYCLLHLHVYTKMKDCAVISCRFCHFADECWGKVLRRICFTRRNHGLCRNFRKARSIRMMKKTRTEIEWRHLFNHSRQMQFHWILLAFINYTLRNHFVGQSSLFNPFVGRVKLKKFGRYIVILAIFCSVIHRLSNLLITSRPWTGCYVRWFRSSFILVRGLSYYLVWNYCLDK